MKAKYISKLEREEKYRPAVKKQEWDLSGLTDEELNILAETVEKENRTAEEEAQLIAILEKLPEVK